MDRVRSACSCCFKKGSSSESVGERDVESQRSEEDSGQREAPEMASSSQDAPLTDGQTPQSVSNLFRGFFRVSKGSKLALKLYGSQKALVEEQNRQRHGKHWVIHPLSTFRWYWDMVMLLLLCVTVTVLPVSIAFYDELNPGWLTVNIITDTLFILDIVVNFRTGLLLQSQYPQTVVLEPKKIAMAYLRGWFIIDFVSSIPFDYLTLFARTGDEDTGLSPSLIKASRALRIVRLTKLLSLLRLLRISRMLRYLQRWEEEFPSLTRFFNVAGGILRIGKLIIFMLLLAHWNGCIQFLVPVLQDVPDNSWIAINRLENAPVFEQYSWSLFKAISHMLCIGFGRWPPQNITEVWLTIISMTIGAMFYALYIGSMSDLILSIDYSGRIYSEKLNQVEEYMRYRKLPQGMRQKVFDYYEHRYQRKYFDEDSILSNLSPGLKEEIISYNCQKLVKTVPFFENAHPEFVMDVITKLHFEVFLKGEHIIKAGTVGHKMYFVQSGVVDVLSEDGELMTSLSDGSHFGEICLLTEDRRVASVKASTTVDLFSLSKEQFQEILDEYPEMKQTMSTVAVERLYKIGLNPPRKLSSNVSCTLTEQTDVCDVDYDSSVVPLSQSERTAEPSEASLAPVRRRQVSFAAEDELVDTRRWSDCPRLDLQLQSEVRTTPMARRKMSLLSTGGKRTAHKLEQNYSGRPGGNPERLPLSPLALVETSPTDPPTATPTDSVHVLHNKLSPSSSTPGGRRSTKVHPLPPVKEGGDVG